MERMIILIINTPETMMEVENTLLDDHFPPQLGGFPRR